ncbi:ankyrin repeat, partial [Thraustotheca clavata]
TEGCTTDAINCSATTDLLHVVEWLHYNRPEGCTTNAINYSTSLDMIQWLHHNRNEGCTTIAMDWAAEIGSIKSVIWLHENRTEGCTKNAMEAAARQGHLNIFQYLYENRTDGCVIAAIDAATSSGHVHIANWLAEKMGAGASAQEFTKLTCRDVAAQVGSLGSAYSPYEVNILANDVDGDVLAHLQPEQLPMLFNTIGVTNTIHQTKLRLLYNDHRPLILKHSMTISRRMEDAIGNAPCKNKVFDVFLSHNWGMDELNRDNHARVAKINAFLQFKMIKCWFDEDQMSGNILKSMAEGIEESLIAVVFVTQLYQSKVNGDNANDNCQLEFGMAKATQTAQWMIPVVMEPGMRATATWSGQFKLILGNQLYIDISSDDPKAFEHGCHNLLSRIEALKTKALPPLSTRRSSKDTMPSSTPRVEIPVTSARNELFSSWQQAIEADIMDLEQDTVAGILDQMMNLPPDMKMDENQFPWSCLAHSMTSSSSPNLQDDACAIAVVLLDILPVTGDFLTSQPSVLHFLSTALAESQDTPANAIVLLCNLSTIEHLSHTLANSKILDQLLVCVSDESMKDEALLPRMETIANLAMHNTVREKLLSSYRHLIITMERRSELTWCILRLFLHVSPHEPSAQILVDDKIFDRMLELTTRPEEMVLKVASHLVQYSFAAKAMGASPHWSQYLLDHIQTGQFVPFCYHIVSALSLESMDILLHNSKEWIELWKAALTQTSTPVTVIICNASLLPQWAAILASDKTLLSALIKRVEEYDDKVAAKSLWNMLVWSEETKSSSVDIQHILDENKHIWLKWKDMNDDEMICIAKQLLRV